MSLVPYVPEDFDAFWLEVLDEARQVPLDFHRSLRNEYNAPGFIVESFHYLGMGGRRLNGWIAYPEGARRLPGFLWIPPYGRESVLPNRYGTREGFVSLSINFHGESPFHQEEYIPSRGYFAFGADSPDSWIFKTMFQNAWLATRVLQALPEADEDRLAAMGMSQGGGIAIWLGAHCDLIKAVCADMPFLCGMNVMLGNQVYRYPVKELYDFAETIPLGMERVKNTIAYFDTLNQATRCHVPTQVTLGERDPACRPEQVEALFEALNGPKLLRRYPGGHDWDFGMVDHNRQWLIQNLGA